MVSLFSIGSYISHAQTPEVRGKITDANGQPMAGVTIQVKGSKVQTMTRPDGTYVITAVPGSKLVITSVGYAPQEVDVTNSNNIAVSLKAATSSMDEVVVVGYGTQKKKNITGALATYNAENLDERPVARVDQALVGQMAGVQVKTTSGNPSKGLSIQVRGTGSITAGNEPLYVIDGFPLATAAANGAGNYATGNPLDNINPNDIESIQVLKDASAAAIYGSRASNGVVLITTKKGKSGKAKISLNTFAGFTEATRKLDMLSGEEWMDRATEMINAKYVADYGKYGAKASDSYEQRRQLLNNPPAGSGLTPANLAVGAYNTAYMLDERWAQPGHPGLRIIDWQKETFRKGLVQNHQVSVSGGNDAVKYYVSGNYNSQQGMIKGMDYQSFSARANVEVNATKNLKVGINLTPTYSIMNDPGVEGKDNILHQILSATPVQEDTMGLYMNTFNNGQYKWSVSTNSPVAKLENIIGQTKRFRTLTSLFAEYKILKSLTFKTTANIDNTDNTGKSYTPYYVAGALSARQSLTNPYQPASGSFNGYNKKTFVNENLFTYNQVFNDIHDLSVLAGQSYNVDKLDRSTLSSNGGFNGNYISTLNYAAGITGNTTETKNVLVSYFGRVQYSLDNKYLFSASLRRDGSSRFGQNTKWGVFPSASVGWRVSEEAFLKNIPVISDLKLRASWGEAGNYNIGDYNSYSTLGFFNYTFNSAAAAGQSPNVLVNPDIRWERSKTYDAGLDIGFLKNRFTASFDYYNKLNTDLLMNIPVAAITGFQTMLSNAGSVRNKGWELELTSRNLTGRKVQWTTTANLSHNRNEVVALAGGQKQLILPSAYGANAQHAILRVGEAMNSIYVIRQVGILSQDDIAKGAALYNGTTQTVGDPKYLDVNNDGVIDFNDRVIVGHPNPDYVWGVTNSVKFKGFDLSVLVQGQTGGAIYSLLGRALGRTGQGASDNPLGFFRDRWRSADNPGAGTVGKAYSTFGQIANTDWLYSSNYVRVRNISLGYDLGRVLHSKAFSGARIYATAENYFGFDKYKGGLNPEATNTDVSGSSLYPEAGDYGGLPLPKTLILGVNFNF
ncbi:TonB-dependent receptor [Paraflavisolibacter sp. H34]